MCGAISLREDERVNFDLARYRYMGVVMERMENGDMNWEEGRRQNNNIGKE